MQNFTGLFLNEIKKGTLSLPIEHSLLSFVDARDIAEASCFLLENSLQDSAYFEITGSQAYSHEHVISLINRASGEEKIFVSMSDSEAKDRFSWNDDIIALFHDMRAGKTSAISKDLEALLKKPARSLPDFVLENAHRFRSIY